jgi:hypothetical protein
MKSLRLALIGIGIAGLVGGAISLAIAASSDHAEDVQIGAVVFTPLIGWSFIGTGLFAWWRRPENRFGALMTAVGFVWFLGSLTTSDVPALFAIGGLFGALPYALLLHMLVAFPTGRLETRWERILVGVGYFDTTVMQVLGVLFQDTTNPDVCTSCPANPILISDQVIASGIAYGLQALIGIFGLTGIAILLVRRWRSASSATRSALTPVLLVGVLTAFLLGLSLIGDVAGVPDGTGEDVIDILGAAAMASVPFAFLIGLLHSRLWRATAVSELVARLGEADRRQGMRDALAEALGDPSLSLAYWVPEQGRYVDAAGHAVELPAGDGTIACTPVELGEPPAERLPPAVESASYFVVAEALTNVARYAEATCAEVSVTRADGQVEVEVSDDGVGGADPAAGSGLRGLADRVAALDGRLEVISPQGEGTVVRAVIPCA